MAGILKVDKYQDFNGNDIMTSDGSGNITINNAALKNTPSFSVYLSANQSINNNTVTLIQFNTEYWDTDSAYDTSTYKFTVPSGQGGKYVFTSSLFMASMDNGETLEHYFYKNGSEILRARNKNDAFGGGQDVITNTSFVVDLAATDYVQLYVRHFAGVTNNLQGGTNYTYFSGYKLLG